MSLNLTYASLNVKLCIFKNYFTNFARLIVRKIIKFIDTRYESIRPLSWNKGDLLLRGGEREKREEGEGKQGEWAPSLSLNVP